MIIRTGGSALIISLLLAGSLNAQNYVLEWQSPEGFSSNQFPDLNDNFWQTGRFDMEGDGVLEIWGITYSSLVDTINVYDGATHTLKWSFPIPFTSGELLGFWDFDGDGLKEALISFNENFMGNTTDVNGLVFVNWMTSEIEFTLGDTILQMDYFARFAADIDNDGKYELIVVTDNYVEIWGDGTTVGISGGSPSYSPQDYTLSQNYPNPFNPSTKIEYAVQQAGHVTIKVFNLRGELVKTLVDQDRPSGEYSAVWDGKNDIGNSVASGQYFYQLSVGDFVTSKKLLLLK